MSKPFKHKFFQPALILLIGFGVWSVPLNSVSRASDLFAPEAQPNSPESTNPKQSTSPQLEGQKLESSSNQRRDDRVYIKDIYPEYCRMYFHRRDWVSLFEYREGMYRCFHGGDRWF